MLPLVAIGPLVTGVRKGLSNCQEDSQPRPQRLPLPAPVALAILELAERLLLGVKWEAEDPSFLLLRATAASIASYLFFNRGECNACALVNDLVINDTHIPLLLRHEKGQQILNEGKRNARQLPSSEAPRIAAMLAAFFTRARAMGPRTRHWALAPVEET